ncbi:hypothetical protein [Devosia sp. Root105]|uniref:hypothetical protein n=1 Tax=Devosia sp. Root105 TaxID=1736423 RepID=UPI0007009987|nr:hypothetical protein [Devosia sp. Root105]KQU96429.1 hypothetical protein ASC68_13705 [Devosia sp. Root105]
MVLARFERDFTDDAGNLLTGNISVEVRRETGGLVPVYSDRAGASALGNPFVNSGGSVAFHCVGGAYKITVTQGGFERILRYVGIGTKQEQDTGQDFAGYGMQWESGTTAPPSAGCVRANNADLSLATKLYVSEVTLAGSDIAARLQEMDSTGKSQQNGIILTQQPAGDTVSWKVSTVVDQSGYKEINVNTHAGETTLNVASISLLRSTTGGDGVDGASMLTRVRVVDTTDSDPATSGYSNGSSVDAVSLVTGDLVLRAAAGHPERNGVWLAPATGGASRDTSFDTYNEHPGAYFSVMEGTAKADTLWRCTSNKGGTLGVTAITLTEFTGGLSGLGSADNTVPRTDGTGGAALQPSALVVDDNADASGLRNVEQISTDAGATEGPTLSLYRNSASPAAADGMGELQFNGKDSGGNKTLYALLRSILDDPANGSEDASVSLRALVAGSMVEHLLIGGGVVGVPRGQLKFPSTAVPSSDANTLDDYEEGAWTPGLAFGGSATGVTFASRGGTYIKIGRIVMVQFNFTLSNNGSGAGGASLTGLPFTSEGASFGQMQVSQWSALSGVVGNPTLTVSPSTTEAVINMSGATASVQMTDTNIPNTGVMIGGGAYFAAA